MRKGTQWEKNTDSSQSLSIRRQLLQHKDQLEERERERWMVDRKQFPYSTFHNQAIRSCPFLLHLSVQPSLYHCFDIREADKKGALKGAASQLFERIDRDERVKEEKRIREREKERRRKENRTTMAEKEREEGWELDG